VIAQAVEVTGELSWYTKGIEILKTRSGQRDVCPNDRSEVKAVIGEWHMLLGERDEALKSFDEGLRLNPRHDRNLLGIAKIFITRGDREGAIEFASRVSGRLKSEADEVLRELRVEGGDEGFTTPMVLNEQAIGRRSEGLNALIQYRLGLTSTNESESLIAQAIEVSVSRREDSVSQLRTLVRSATSQKEKDFVLLRLVSVVVIQYGDSEMGKTILGEVSSNSNHSTEFRFLNSLLDAVCDTTGLSEILKLYIAFHRSKKKEKRDLKSMVSKITQLDALTLLELDVTESVLDRLSAIRVSRREFAKAIEVCELWSAVVRGNPTAKERYGQSLLGGGRVDEAIPALLDAKTANSKKLLVEAYKQTNRKHDLIKLMLSNELLMDTGLLKQQLLSLRIG
jgi:tetratricopeptide (TPR) repeat protein